MLNISRVLIAAVAIFTSLSSPLIASAPNPIVDGVARFTVITPNCIRIESKGSGGFIDNPSLFAANRSSRYGNFSFAKSGGSDVINTGAIKLTYTPDGLAVGASNLTGEIKTDSGWTKWVPGMPNNGNLGGTARTLDGVTGPFDLGQGIISRDGWYLLDDSKSDLLTSDWVMQRPQNSGTDWYLFGYGSDYHAALKSLTAVGGAVPMPRRYALGAWYSRYWPYTSAQYRQIIDEYKQHDFPIDNIVMDMDWHKDGWTGWSWNRKLLPDAEELLAWFHKQGLHVTLNLHPADGVGPQEDQYAAFMKDMGADPATQKTITFDAANKKYMDTLFADIFRPLEKDGVDFWWLDWQQYPFTVSIPDLTNLFWLNTLLYDRTSMGDQRGLSFSRWAGWGDHRHPIHFSGDANTGFPMLAFEVPFTSTAGNVGCFFWSHDIGGHMGGRNEESYTRWVQFGATSPVLRSHSTRSADMDRRPWTYPLWAENSMRKSFHLRSKLFPYIYTSAWQAAHDSEPLDRPMYFDNPRDENAYHNAQEYMLGDNLLCAPIVTQGVGPGRVGSQTVWFPNGSWFNMFTGESYGGDRQALVSADINEFPIYARGGVPIPMQPYTDRMGTTPISTLNIKCFPGHNGKLGQTTLHEDDGTTVAYRKGAYATTPISYMRNGGTVRVNVGPTVGKYAGQLSDRTLLLELPDTTDFGNVKCSSGTVVASYDPRTFTTTVLVPSHSIWSDCTITLQIGTAGEPALHAKATARRVAGIVGDDTAYPKVLKRNLSDDQMEAVFAAEGLGIVAKNNAPYLFNGTITPTLYAQRGVVTGDTVVINGRAHKIDGVTPIDVSEAYTWKGKTFRRSVPVTFTVAGSTYTLQGDVNAGSELTSSDNVTQYAAVSVSGSENGYSAEGAVDGLLGGYPGVKSQEWSAGSTLGAWIRLDWTSPQTIDRVSLYDRPNLTDQVTAGTLTFSDGSSVSVGALPNDGRTPAEVRFPAKTVTWVKFTISSVKDGTQNAGLSEIGVFKAK